MKKQQIFVVGSLVGSLYCTLFKKNNVHTSPMLQFSECRNSVLKVVQPRAVALCEGLHNLESGDQTDGECTVHDHEEIQVVQKTTSGFKDRKIDRYENQLREYSNPDKIFRYFATYKYVYENGESEIFMTPDDFVRAITPGERQPENLGLDHFKVKKVAANDAIAAHCDHYCKEVEAKKSQKVQIFDNLGCCRMINFNDYIFLLMVLSTPPRNFEIAFHIFDLDGDGELDVVEFNSATRIAKTHTTNGSSTADPVVAVSATGSYTKFSSESTSAIMSHFFGPTWTERKLTVQKFLDFQRSLQDDLLRLEFERNKTNPEDEVIREDNFIRMLINFSGLTDKQCRSIIKRVRKQYCSKGVECKGLTFDETKAFFHFLNHIHDVDVAFDYHRVIGTDIDKPTMKLVARTVAGQEISDHTIDVVFSAFDVAGVDAIRSREFVQIMRSRLGRGLGKPRDLGFCRLINAVVACAHKTDWRS